MDGTSHVAPPRASVVNGCFVEAVEFFEIYRKAHPLERVRLYDMGQAEMGVAGPAARGHSIVYFTRNRMVHAWDYMLGEFLVAKTLDVLSHATLLERAILKAYRTAAGARRRHIALVEDVGYSAVVNAYRRLSPHANTQAQCIRIEDCGTVREGVAFMFVDLICLYFPDAGTVRAKLTKTTLQHITEMGKLSPAAKLTAFIPRAG